MKKILLLITITVLTISSSFAQSSPPESFKYQAIVRDASGNIISNQLVGFQFTIIQGAATGTPVYQETFSLNTNGYGLVNMDIGRGVVVSGTFSTIDWSLGPYFIETGLDVTGGTTYAIMTTNELMSVPYALYAKTSGGGPAGPAGSTGPAGATGATGQDGATSILQQTTLPVGDVNCPNGGLLIENGIDSDNNGMLSPSEVTSFGYVCNGDDASDDQIIDSLWLTGSILSVSIENGNVANIDLSTIDTDTHIDSLGIAALGYVAGPHTIDTDDQNLSISAGQDSLLIEDGQGVLLSSLADADADPTNEYNTSVVLNGTDLEVTDLGGTITVPLLSLVGDDQNIDSVKLFPTKFY